MTTFESVKAWYGARHAALGIDAWRPPQAYPLLLDALAPRAGATLLDVGCGTGLLLAEADRRGVTTYGVDLSLEGVRIARGASPRSTAVVARGEVLPFRDRTFDYVTCTGSLEHFLDMRAGLREIARTIKPGGRVLIVVPNADYFLVKLGRRAGTGQQLIREVLLPLVAWRRLFEDTGLTVRAMTKDSWPVHTHLPWRASSLRGAVRRLLYITLFLLLPVSLTYQIVFTLDAPA